MNISNYGTGFCMRSLRNEYFQIWSWLLDDAIRKSLRDEYFHIWFLNLDDAMRKSLRDEYFQLWYWLLYEVTAQ